MNQPQNDLFATQVIPPTAYILTHLDLYNWGPFGGRHCAEIDPRGTAIIGPTGSGKTTLVDALMTLLTHQPRYNLASTGGHESDRDLISYIRGVSGAGNNTGDNSHIARPGKTLTAISARFSNGDKTLHIGALFWIDGSSSAASDLKRLWLFSERDDQHLDDWLGIHQEGGVRALKQHAKETPGLQIHDSKKSYLAQLRRFFEVGENAFTLLNRAAGLKQLNSIDEIFRELVLDDHSAFNRAAEVASEFDDLATIHNELETARKQYQSLLPIAETYSRHQAILTDLEQQRALKVILPIWYAQAGHRLWSIHVNDLKDQISTVKNSIQTLTDSVDQLSSEADVLKDIYLQAGGASIEQLKGQIQQQQRWLDDRQRNAQDYQTLTRKLGLEDTLSPEALDANRRQSKAKLEELSGRRDTQDSKLLDLRIEHSKLEETLLELTKEIERVKARPGSNIDGHYQEFRSALAQALNLREDQLPFVAELVEVKNEEKEWRGAIERAIGGHRLRIMVPPPTMQSALNLVNSRDNRLHVRLLEAAPPRSLAKFMDDGFTRKLNFKDHPYREALKQLLASIDRHCVDSPETLRQTAHGMTRQGLMSGRKGYFEKQDKQPLHKGWMTGFDNRDRLAALNSELEETRLAESDAREKLNAARAALEDTRVLITFHEQLISIEFDSIDLPGAKAELYSLQQRLQELTSPDSDVEKARQKFETVNQELERNRKRLSAQEAGLAVLEDKLQQATRRCEELLERIGEGLTDEQQSLAGSCFKTPAPDQYDQLEKLERKQREQLDQSITKLGKQIQGYELNLTQQMEKARAIDTGALAETGSDIRDIPVYLERLRVLEEEALPQKLERFLSYLNQSSDQGVTQLLAHIQNQVTIIEERIADLNATLYRVDFQPGRYLRLEPRRVTHESLRTLERAQRQLRSDALKDDQGESHFKSLQHMVALLRDAAENKRTQGARALLDPRYRLQFEVSVLDRESGVIIETRTGSQGGSGGEKEIIASYILTASLSYALCPDGASLPLFGTIVLDEAFSKSSQAVAGRIISALNEFGLHPLFVTPNKEMRLLRAHTRSAILVHRKHQQATLTSLSWEELETHAEKRTRIPHEISI